jgi:signal transduction histidine kinase
VFYSMTHTAHEAEPVLEMQAGYGFEQRKSLSTSFHLGEGLVGQCTKEKKRILLTEVPGEYVRINSGLGASTPLNIIVLPILFEGSVRAVVELASFSPFSVTHQTFLDQLTESIGLVLNTIDANTLTENLLKQSQSQAEELRSQQEELRESNEDLGRQATLLAERNMEAEKKNQEIERSKLLVEEKAGELSLFSSRYKSEFIANMSHELRTPLNSLLILAEQLEDNSEGNMTATQVKYASVILDSGRDLLRLLNGILDLAKVESATVTIETSKVDLEDFRTLLVREFEQVAERSDVGYAIDITSDCPTHIVTDPHRLRQILKNLLANAFKFTVRGQVDLKVSLVEGTWRGAAPALREAPLVMAFAVKDTGIGIEQEEQRRIFEPFAQVDGGTSRDYGGTGLGLSISRALVGLLDGEITVESTPGEGSTFTVYLPLGRPPTLPPVALLGSTAPNRSDESAIDRDVTSARNNMRDGPAGPARGDDMVFAGTRVLVVDDISATCSQ